MPHRRKLLAKTTASVEEIDLILRAEHSDPFHVLGAHPVAVRGKPAVAIRAFLPNARQAWVVTGSAAAPLRRVQREGFFERVFPDEGVSGICGSRSLQGNDNVQPT
jgi:1,4-alpha-glucan branching enzyme